MTKTVCFALAAALVLTGVAHAEPAPKSEDVALWLSAGGALTSAALAGVGGLLALATDDNCFGGNCPPARHPTLNKVGEAMFTTGVLTSALTPMLGEWYANKYLTAGLGLRAGGAVLALIGSYRGCTCGIEAPLHDPNYGLIGVGLAVYVGGVVYDVATARSVTRDYNASHPLHVTVVPTTIAQRSGQSYGFGVAGSF
jgi:hypothetical protein